MIFYAYRLQSGRWTKGKEQTKQTEWQSSDEKYIFDVHHLLIYITIIIIKFDATKQKWVNLCLKSDNRIYSFKIYIRNFNINTHTTVPE